MTGTGGATATRDRTASHAAETVDILGVRIHRVRYDQSIDLIRGFASGEGKHQVVTVNPEFVIEAQRNRAFMDVLNTASLSVPDGIGVIYASRLLGRPLHERIAGADLTESICALSARHGFGIFLLGAAEGVAERTAAVLSEKYPGLRVVGTFAGSAAPEGLLEIRERVNAARPDFLFVAFGSPKQEIWIADNLPGLDVSVAVGVGGTFDFISGTAVRAPRWVRNAGMEWFHRLLKEPSRWRRMLALPVFAARCVSHRIVSGKAG